MLTMKKYRGVTLVELMIALVISTIVLLGVATVYSSTKRSYKVQEEMARLQENARYAFAAMAQDIRGAGFIGCNPTITNHLDPNGTGYSEELFDFQSGIAGWEYTSGNGTAPGDDYTITSVTAMGAAGDWGGIDWNNDGSADNLNSVLVGDVLHGSDVLAVKSSETLEWLIPSGNTQATSASITFSEATGVPGGAIVIFSDCKRADVFQNNPGASTTDVSLTRSTAGDPGNLNPATTFWSHEYTDEARLQVVKTHVYFIGTSLTTGEPALFRADYSEGTGGVTPEELVIGVENMQILYGEDLNTGDSDIQPTRYVTADNISAPDNVISVRISLLMRTPEELNRPQVPSTNRLLGVDDTTGIDITSQSDRRIRKVFTTTIYLRNKGITRVRI